LIFLEDPPLSASAGEPSLWAYFRHALVRFNPFHSFQWYSTYFLGTDATPDPDSDNHQLEHQPSDPLNQSDGPPAYPEPGIGTCPFFTDIGLTQVYTSGNRAICTETSPTMFAGSNATIITPTTPTMITQAVQTAVVSAVMLLMSPKIRSITVKFFTFVSCDTCNLLCCSYTYTCSIPNS